MIIVIITNYIADNRMLDIKLSYIYNTVHEAELGGGFMTDIKEAERETKNANLYELVANMMEEDIISVRSCGERLPSEQHMAEQYEVSRTVIREALKILSERGLIDSKIGSGAFVTRPEAQNLSDVFYRIIHMHDIDYTSAFDVRAILEEAAAKKAARFITDEELEDMERILEKLKDYSLSQEDRNEYDFQFHQLVANASRNKLLAMLINAMGRVIKDLIGLSSAADGAIEDGIYCHANVVEALREHDPEMAEHMMIEHIYRSKRFYLEHQRLSRLET